MNGNLISVLAGTGVAAVTLAAGLNLSGLIGGDRAAVAPDASPNLVYVEQPVTEVPASTPAPLPPLIIAITSPAAATAAPAHPEATPAADPASTPAPIALPSAAPGDDDRAGAEVEGGPEGGGEWESDDGGFDD